MNNQPHVNVTQNGTQIAPRNPIDTPQNGLRLTDAPPVATTESPETKPTAPQRRWLEPIKSAINPLIGAADPLFSQIYALTRNGPTPDPDSVAALNVELRKQLVDFEREARREGYEESLVFAARYALCTLLDEAVVTHLKNAEGLWTTNSLLSYFHGETTGGAKYFVLIERYSANPARYLDMLELLYLGIAMGFKGTHGTLAGGERDLELIRSELYANIRQLRGEVEPELSPHWRGLGAAPQRVVRAVPWWGVLLFTGACLAIMYSGFAWVLHEETQRTIRALQMNDPTRAAEYSTLEVDQ